MRGSDAYVKHCGFWDLRLGHPSPPGLVRVRVRVTTGHVLFKKGEPTATADVAGHI